MRKIAIFFILALTMVVALAVLAYFYTSPIPSYNPNEEYGPYSYHEKEITVTLNKDGTSHERILWKIEVKGYFIYIPTGEWGIQIPKNIKDITITDPNGQMDFQIQETENKYDLLIFENSEKIKRNSEYFFDIQYTNTKNPIIYEPFYFYQKSFTRFDTDEEFSLSIELPKNSALISSTKIPEIQDNTLKYNLEKEETAQIKINFKIPDTEARISTVSSKYYQAILPSRYSKEYSKILEKADEGFELIEKIYGFSPDFEKIKIETINSNEIDFEEHTEAYFLGQNLEGYGRVRIKATRLGKTEKEILYTIIHETIHGFNSKYFPDKVPNNFFEEGTAQFIAYEVLEELGYDTSGLTKQNNELNTACENTDKDFISEWSPNLYLKTNQNQKIECSNILTSPITLGYAHSYQIMQKLDSEYGINIFKNFFRMAKQTEIEFSSDHNTLNNQINFILSKAAAKETTSLLNSLGIQVEKIDEDNEEYRSVTGLPILEDEKEPEYTKLIYLILITTIIALTIVALTRKSNRKKLKANLEKFSPYYKFK